MSRRRLGHFRQGGTQHVQPQKLGVLHVSERVVEMRVGRKGLDNILDAVKVPLGTVNHGLEQLNNRAIHVFSPSTAAW